MAQRVPGVTQKAPGPGLEGALQEISAVSREALPFQGRIASCDSPGTCPSLLLCAPWRAPFRTGHIWTKPRAEPCGGLAAPLRSVALRYPGEPRRPEGERRPPASGPELIPGDESRLSPGGGSGLAPTAAAACLRLPPRGTVLAALERLASGLTLPAPLSLSVSHRSEQRLQPALLVSSCV